MPSIAESVTAACLVLIAATALIVAGVSVHANTYLSVALIAAGVMFIAAAVAVWVFWLRRNRRNSGFGHSQFDGFSSNSMDRTPTEGRMTSTTPSGSEKVAVHALGWRKQVFVPESEAIFTTSPDPACSENDPGAILGIDLGTTHSVIAVFRQGRVEIIPNEEGQSSTPSVVLFAESGEVLVGSKAQQRAVTDPLRTVFSVKRLLGRSRSDLPSFSERSACELVAGRDDSLNLLIDGKRHTPVEIVARILGKLKDAAEHYLGHAARRAVITVPAFFTDAQRQAVLSAAELAGFDVDWIMEDTKTGNKIRQRMRIISEPTAAALAIAHVSQKERTLAVFHMGGGTFDITLMEIGHGVLSVKAVGGDTQLGGDDFDQALVDHLLGQVPADWRERIRHDAVARQRLRLSAEQAKRDLSQQSEVTISLPFLVAGREEFRVKVSRDELERIVAPLIEKCQELVKQTLSGEGWKGKAIDEVLVIGGMTRMPRLLQLFRLLFPSESQRAVNQDDIVAHGAAIQGRQLALGSQSDFLVLDVVPLTLGLESDSGQFIPVIPRNSTIPHSRTEVFTCADDFQPGVSIRVYQIEERSGRPQKFLGQLDLDGLNAPAQQTRIAVTFDVDHNGILRVMAKDIASGREAMMKVTPRLPADLLQARQNVILSVRKVEKLLKVLGRHFLTADLHPVRRLIDRGRNCYRADDIDVIRQTTQELERVAEALNRHADQNAAANSSKGNDANPQDEKPGFQMNIEI